MTNITGFEIKIKKGQEEVKDLLIERDKIERKIGHIESRIRYAKNQIKLMRGGRRR